MTMLTACRIGARQSMVAMIEFTNGGMDQTIWFLTGDTQPSMWAPYAIDTMTTSATINGMK